MKKDQKSAALPQIEASLQTLGASLRRIRLARRLGIAGAAARAGVSVSTLQRLEQGDPSVSMGSYAGVMNILDLLSEVRTVVEVKAAKAAKAVADQSLPQRVRSSNKRYNF